jgi:hypothetical protein
MRTLLLILIFSGSLAWWASQVPAPLPATAPAAQFSAGRALQDITALAARPRPVGSAAHDAAAGYLEGRLRELGFAVHRQDATLGGKALRNVIGVRAGSDWHAAPIALMAHYDSVPGSPGAADDATGVAVALEVARALQSEGEPARGLAIVLTDGEELGLLGARAFYDGDPLAAQLGPVLNMEARGGGGRVFMFETSDGNGGLVDLFRQVTHNPTSNSLSVFVYRHMPNDTDFTVVRRHGGAGLNYAFIGREVDYHAPGSTVARLEPGSVQHMGEQVLAMARALVNARVLPARAPDLVYADVLGVATLAYRPAFGWLLVGLALASLAIATRQSISAGVRWRPVLAGAVGALLVLLASAAAAWLARRLVGAPAAHATVLPVLQAFGRFEAALALCALGAALAAAALVGARRPGSWLGSLWFAWLLAAAAQYFAPATGFLVAWPLCVALACLLVSSMGPRSGRARQLASWFTTFAAVLAVAQCAYLGHGVLLGVGAALPMVVALFAWLASVNLWPWLEPMDSRARGVALGSGLAATGLLLALSIRWLA